MHAKTESSTPEATGRGLSSIARATNAEVKYIANFVDDYNNKAFEKYLRGNRIDVDFGPSRPSAGVVLITTMLQCEDRGVKETLLSDNWPRIVVVSSI